MAGIILCRSQYAQQPYIIKMTGAKVYSIEELCYYIYNDLEAIADYFPEIGLIHWIGDELGLHDTEEQLLAMKGLGKNPHDILLSFIGKQDYLNEKEQKLIKKRIEGWKKLSNIEKLFVQADIAMRYNKFTLAARVYLNVIEAEGVADAALKSKAFHNLGVIRAKLFEMDIAKQYFYEAYQIGGREESYIQYLHCLNQLGDLGKLEQNLNEADKFLKLPESKMHVQYLWAKYYDASHEHDKALACMEAAQAISPVFLEELKIRKKQSKDYMSVRRAAALKQSGKLSEYYYLVDGLLEQWKIDYQNMHD